MNSCVTFCVLISVFGAFGDQLSYDGYTLWSVTPLTASAAEKLHNLENQDGFDFWTPPRRMAGEATKIIVSPEQRLSFDEFLTNANFESELLIENLEHTLEIERENQKAGIEKLLKTGFSVNSSLPIDHFWTYDEINRYVNYLVRNYSDIIQAEQVGRSVEARMIKAYKISLNGKVDGTRPIIFIDATTHAREWASPVTAMYLMHQLVEKSADHDFLKHVDWIIVPVVNPDGYIHSHDKARLWRKNRRILDNCTGVDVNRNYGYRFNRTYKCDNSYSGPYAFSEPETRAVRNVFHKYFGKIRLYASIHAWASMILYPWGYDVIPVDNWEEHAELGNRFAKAVAAKTQTNYTVGNAADLLYKAAGGSDDYAIAAGVNLAYTIELNGTKEHKFHPTPEQLPNIVTEAFAGIVEFARYVAEQWGNGYEGHEQEAGRSGIGNC